MDAFAKVNPCSLKIPRATARAVKEVHEVLSNALLFLALAHAAAALFHHWILRDDVLRRMWPFGDHNAS